jgi:hypothetical protein
VYIIDIASILTYKLIDSLYNITGSQTVCYNLSHFFFMAYIYKHIRKDTNEVFYIGIGSDLDYGRANSKSGRNKYWKRIVNKVGYYIEIIEDNLIWEQACENEKQFIKQYGRKDLSEGTLVNMTNGGDGGDTSMYIDYTKRNISGSNNGMYGKNHSDEAKNKVSAKNSGKKVWNTDLTKQTSPALKIVSEKLKKAMTGRVNGPNSKETNKKISTALIGRVQPTTICTFCGKVGSVSNMKRWHGDNCKSKIKKQL